MKKPTGIRKGWAAAVVVLLSVIGVIGVAAPAQAVRGTSVYFGVLGEGVPSSVVLHNTSFSGYKYEQTYGTTRKNVQKTCPPSGDYRLQVPSKFGGTALLKPGVCKTWLKKGLKTVGVFLAEPTSPPPTDEWPDATNTGFQGDPSTLRATTGRRITTPGTIIQNERINTSNGALVIDAPNVTVRNVIIDAGIWGIDALHTADGLTVEDSTIVGGLQAGIGLDQTGGWLDGWTIQRNNMHGGNDAIKPSGTGVVRDNYLHDLGQLGNDPHNDAMQFGDVDGVLVQHNMMKCRDTSCIAMFEGQATFKNVTIDNNHMTGAGYILYAGGTSGTNIVVTDNVFGQWGYGPVTWFQTKPGNVWSGNVDLSGNVVNSAY